MLVRKYDGQICSVARTLEVVGERWTLLIVRDALTGVSRFDHFRRRLGVAASVLKVRLDRLVVAGVLERSPYQRRPFRYDYRLTAKGRDLALVVMSLMSWGDRHLVGAEGPPKTAHHDGCGGKVTLQLTCLGCHTPVTADNVIIRRTAPRDPDRSPPA